MMHAQVDASANLRGADRQRRVVLCGNRDVRRGRRLRAAERRQRARAEAWPARHKELPSQSKRRALRAGT